MNNFFMDIPYTIVDNFLSEEYNETVLKYCLETKYSYGERDVHDPDAAVSGMIRNLTKYEDPYNIISKRIVEVFPDIKDLELNRMYINCFAPNENTYFHIDGCKYTFIYYPQKDWNLAEGGETQFYVNETIIGSPPKPNRMIMFSGKSLIHRAVSFRNKHRFTISIKYDSLN